MRKYAFLFALAAFTNAQEVREADPAALRVRGTVRDASTGLPLSGARVSLVPGISFRFGLDQPAAFATGPDGRFDLLAPAAGSYYLDVSAPGYLPEGGVPRGANVPPAREITVLMVRTSSLQGRIVDTETDEPISGVWVLPMTAKYDHGHLVPHLHPGIPRKPTGQDGVFQFDALLPGSYFLRLEVPGEEPRILAGETLEKFPAHTGYGRQWWPGVDAPLRSGMIQALGGASMRLPDVRLPKRQLARVSGFVRADSCEPGDLYRLSIMQFHGTLLGSSNFTAYETPAVSVHCGGEFLVTNLSPGSYEFVAIRAGGEKKVAREQVAVYADTQRDVYPLPGVPLEVSVQLPEDLPAGDRTRLVLAARPLQGPADGASNQSVPLSNGRARLTLFGDRPVQLSLRGLRPPYYISKVIYSGREMADAVLGPQRYSPDQSVKITVSADGAALLGLVRDGDKPAPHAQVVAVSVPLRSLAGFPVHYLGASDEEGRFSIEGLPPGEYRVLSVAAGVWNDELQKPGMLAALASNAESVAVSAGGAAQVTLELIRLASAP